MRCARAFVPLCLLAAGCATLAGGGGGEDDLPNAGAGPFREIRQAELGNFRSAPNALEDDEIFPRDPAILDVDGDPATLEVLAFVAATLLPEGEEPDADAPPNAIVRYGALDGRSFDRSAVVVLTPEGTDEAETVGSPAVLRADGELLLYYQHGAGIGVATSIDGGGTFARAPGAGLAAADAGWDAGATPRAPSVVRLPGGAFRMFYEVDFGPDGATAIGEATSSDGRSWQRGGAPVLTPRDPAQAPADEPPWDGRAVGSPFAVLTENALGEPIVRLYHAAISAEGARVIALAARAGLDGSFERAVSPVFGTQNDLAAHEPCFVHFDGFALLYVTQRAGTGIGEAYPSVGVGVAPATITLPAPNPL
jgi:hypothetical protein